MRGRGVEVSKTLFYAMSEALSLLDLSMIAGLFWLTEKYI